MIYNQTITKTDVIKTEIGIEIVADGDLSKVVDPKELVLYLVPVIKAEELINYQAYLYKKATSQGEENAWIPMGTVVDIDTLKTELDKQYVTDSELQTAIEEAIKKLPESEMPNLDDINRRLDDHDVSVNNLSNDLIEVEDAVTSLSQAQQSTQDALTTHLQSYVNHLEDYDTLVNEVNAIPETYLSQQTAAETYATKTEMKEYFVIPEGEVLQRVYCHNIEMKYLHTRFDENGLVLNQNKGIFEIHFQLFSTNPNPYALDRYDSAATSEEPLTQAEAYVLSMLHHDMRGALGLNYFTTASGALVGLKAKTDGSTITAIVSTGRCIVSGVKVTVNTSLNPAIRYFCVTGTAVDGSGSFGGYPVLIPCGAEKLDDSNMPTYTLADIDEANLANFTKQQISIRDTVTPLFVTAQ